MVTRDQIRSDLLAAYRWRIEDSFVQTLLRSVTDPVKPLSETKKRRFHRLLVTGVVLAVVCLALTLWLSR